MHWRGGTIVVVFVIAQLACALLCTGASWGAEPVRLDLGKFDLTAPSTWTKKPPRSQLIQYEMAAPAAEGDGEGGRLTVMSAGGSVEANIERWCAQFAQPDGSATRDRAKIEKKTIAGQEVHLVDLSGTYDDKPAPVAPGVKKPKFRMLAAVIVTSEANFFVKFYGPERTIADQADAFHDFIESLRAK